MHRPRMLSLYFQDLRLYIFLYNIKPVSMRIVKVTFTFGLIAWKKYLQDFYKSTVKLFRNLEYFSKLQCVL